MNTLEFTSHLLATLYAILIIVGYVPGIYSLIKEESLKGVSDNFWYLIVVTVGISFYNVMLIDATIYQIISIGLNLLLGLISLFICSYRKHGTTGVLWGFLFIIALYAFSSITKNIPSVSQNVASVAITLAYIGQIYRYKTTKTSEGTNSKLYLIMSIALACITISLILSHTPWYIILTDFINMMLAITCYIQSKHYKEKKNEKNYEFGEIRE